VYVDEQTVKQRGSAQRDSRPLGGSKLETPFLESWAKVDLYVVV